MGASSGLALLTLVVMMDRLGLTIGWFPFCVGELEVLLKLGLGGVNLAVATAVLTSRGVDLSLPIWLTSLEVRKMPVPLRAASVTISFGSTVWCTPKASRIPGTSSVMIGSIR